MATDNPRDGEVTHPGNPAEVPDAGVIFIGHLSTPWEKGDCPRNLTEARARGGDFLAVIKPEFRLALQGLTVGDACVLLYWMHAARRDLLIQAPGHRPDPVGTFALRSPARPNPISMAIVRITGIDRQAGTLRVDALDAFDGTPLLDIKPWLPSVDIPPDGLE